MTCISVATSCSRLSLISQCAETRCYLPDTLFKVPGQGQQFVEASSLERGHFVLGTIGPVAILSVTTHPKGRQNLVRLLTSHSSHVVTDSHRLMVSCPAGSRVQLAGQTIIGEKVWCGGILCNLEAVQHFRQRTQVVEVTFDGDATVEVFPPEILVCGLATKGRPPAEILLKQLEERRPRSRTLSFSPSRKPDLRADFCPWSLGTRDHDPRQPQLCDVCRDYHRHGTCKVGVGCSKCHAPHPEMPKRVRARRGE